MTNHPVYEPRAEEPGAAPVGLAADYAAIGVDASALQRYLGKPLAEADGVEYDHMRRLLVAIKRGTTTWSEALDYKLDKDLERNVES